MSSWLIEWALCLNQSSLSLNKVGSKRLVYLYIIINKKKEYPVIGYWCLSFLPEKEVIRNLVVRCGLSTYLYNILYIMPYNRQVNWTRFKNYLKFIMNHKRWMTHTQIERILINEILLCHVILGFYSCFLFFFLEIFWTFLNIFLNDF